MLKKAHYDYNLRLCIYNDVMNFLWAAAASQCPNMELREPKLEQKLDTPAFEKGNFNETLQH